VFCLAAAVGVLPIAVLAWRRRLLASAVVTPAWLRQSQQTLVKE